jgi:hypothetical protein
VNNLGRIPLGDKYKEWGGGIRIERCARLDRIKN